MELDHDEPSARALVEAVRTGDAQSLQRLLDEQPGLASAVIRDAKGVGRTAMHFASDWPGYFPNAPAIIALLAAGGADPNARAGANIAETPLHWAASSDDVDVVLALIEAGADINAPDGSIGTPLVNAVGYGCWHTARLLAERGADLGDDLWIPAGLGLLEQVDARCRAEPGPSPDEIDEAFWHACHGGQRRVAEYLLGLGAQLDVVQDHSDGTALDAARELDTRREQLAEWLVFRGARSATSD